MALFPKTGAAPEPGVARLQMPATLREAVVAQLRTAIVAGELAPGALLKDAELAAQLGLSTTPVREALMQLAAEGLVEIEPNRLKRVTPIDLDAMVELFEVQSRLWGLGYVWGAPRIGPDELAHLQRVYAEHAAAIERGDNAVAIAAAHAFHRVFMEASGNRELLRVSLDRLALIQRFVRLRAPWLISLEGLAQHRAMLDALDRGDVQKTIALYEDTSAVLSNVARELRDLKIKSEEKIMTQNTQKLSLEDERDIAAVIVRYGSGIDSRNWALFRSCFADDVHADYGQFGTWNGCEEFAAAMEKTHEPMGMTLHRMSNIVIAAIAGGAKVRTYVDAVLCAKEADGAFRQGIGYYDDELIKTGEGWRIKNRQFNSVRIF
jgi:DNA-binding GntR family transcriptional regulator